MKTNFWGRFLLGMAVLLAIPLHAQVYNNISISGIMMKQTPNRTNGTTPPPMQTPFTTQTLLQDLAADEDTGGVWTNSLPKSAHLQFNMTDFIVTGPQGQLFDASNILNFVTAGANWITTSLSNDWRNSGVIELDYDATSVGSSDQFTIVGFGTVKQSAGQVLSNGSIYNVTYYSLDFRNGVGTGTNAIGQSFILNDVTITARGSVWVFKEVYDPNPNPNDYISGFSISSSLVTAPTTPVSTLPIEPLSSAPPLPLPGLTRAQKR